MYNLHAKLRYVERGLSLDDIERAVTYPIETINDLPHKNYKSFIKVNSQYLIVIHTNPNKPEIIIITAYYKDKGGLKNLAPVTFDLRFRTMYINFTGKSNKVTKTITVANGQELDIDKDGNAVGLEVLFSSNMSEEATEALLKLVKNSRKRSLVFHALRRDVELTPSHKLLINLS